MCVDELNKSIENVFENYNQINKDNVKVLDDFTKKQEERFKSIDEKFSHNLDAIEGMLNLLTAKQLKIMNITQKFESIFDNTDAGIVLYDYTTKRIIDINPAALFIFNIKANDKQSYIGKNVDEVFRCKQCDISQLDENHECVCYTIDDEEINILKKTTEVSPTNDNKYIIDTFLNITERRKEQTLRQEQEALVSTIIDTTPGGVLFIKDDYIQWGNNAIYSILKYKPEELIGKKVDILFNSNEEFNNMKSDIFSLTDKSVLEKQVNFLTSEGEEVNIIFMVCHLDPNDKTKGLVASVTDMRDIIEARHTLNMRSNLFQGVAEALTLLMRNFKESDIRSILEMIGLKVNVNKLFFYVLTDGVFKLKSHWVHNDEIVKNLANDTEYHLFNGFTPTELDLKFPNLQLGTKIMNGKFINLNLKSLTGDTLEEFKQFGVKSLLISPYVRNGNEFVSFTGWSNHRDDCIWSDFHISTLGILSQAIGNFFKNQKDLDYLRLNRNILNALLNSVPFPIFVVDNSDNFILTNYEFDHVFGKIKKDIDIMTVSTFFNEENMKSIVSDSYCRVSHQIVLHNKKIVSVSNDVMYYDIIKSPFIIDNSNLGTIIIFLNVGDRNNTENLFAEFLNSLDKHKR